MPSIEFDVPQNLIDYLDRRATKGNMPLNSVLVGALRRDQALHRKVDKMAADDVVGAVGRINDAVIRAFGEMGVISISAELMVSPIRYNAVVSQARMIAWVILRKCNVSYPQIGLSYQRDHTSIMYGVRRTETSAQIYQDIKWLIARSCEIAGIKGDKVPEKPESLSFVKSPSEIIRMRGQAESDLGPKEPEYQWSEEEKEAKRLAMKSGRTGKRGRDGDYYARQHGEGGSALYLGGSQVLGNGQRDPHHRISVDYNGR